MTWSEAINEQHGLGASMFFSLHYQIYIIGNSETFWDFILSVRADAIGVEQLSGQY